MKTMANKIILVCLLTISPLVMAQKIVVFNPEVAIFSTQAAKQLSVVISQQLSGQLLRMQALRTDIEQSQQRLNQDQALMSAEELETAQQYLQEQTLEYRKLQDYVNTVKQQNEQTLMQNIRPKLDATMKTYIESNAIDLVINANAVVYVSGSLDITNQIIQILDQE